MNNTITILSIETSCDETGISVVKYDKNTKKYNVLADSLNSQIDIHKEFGGVFPMLAKREHGNNLTHLLTNCLGEISSSDKSSIDKKNIDFDFIFSNNYNWDIFYLSQNPNLTFNIIDNYDYRWEYQYMAYNTFDKQREITLSNIIV